MTTTKLPLEGPVLVAVDFSDSSAAAVLWAADWARLVETDMVVLHVIHDPADAPGYYHDAQVAGGALDSDQFIRTIEGAASRMLSAFLESARAEAPDPWPAESMQTRLIIGTPVTRILDVAQQIGARLIVMGSQGRTGLAHFMLGSRAERVARLATIPVVIVKIPQDENEE